MSIGITLDLNLNLEEYKSFDSIAQRLGMSLAEKNLDLTELTMINVLMDIQRLLKIKFENDALLIKNSGEVINGYDPCELFDEEETGLNLNLSYMNYELVGWNYHSNLLHEGYEKTEITGADYKITLVLAEEG